MATATDRQKTAKENFTVPDAGERKVTLLVVEDDENISTAISEYFSRAGYSVKTVEDGLNGVKAALDDPTDAVVLDLMLPKMDGLAVCKELREKVGYLPILMLTAKDDVVDKVLDSKWVRMITSPNPSAYVSSRPASNPCFVVRELVRRRTAFVTRLQSFEVV